jgi:hypothetical protein
VEFTDETTGHGEWMWPRVVRCDDEKPVVYGRLDDEPLNGYGGKLGLGSELAVRFSQVREAAERVSDGEAWHLPPTLGARRTIRRLVGGIVCKSSSGCPAVRVLQRAQNPKTITVDRNASNFMPGVRFRLVRVS